MGQKRRRPVRKKDNTGEAWARIHSCRSKYYISRNDLARDEVCRIDDEAQLEIVATIEVITPAQRAHLGEQIFISLLAATKYAPEDRSAPFFGSVSLRGQQRSALAYLPSRPFWELPAIIRGGAGNICLGWTSMRRGYAELGSIFLGDDEDRIELLELGGNTLVTQIERRTS